MGLEKPELMPEFGTKSDGIDYIDRPGVYALIENNHRRIAVIQTPRGYFLPGGGIERGESDNDALQREILEEIGHQASILQEVGEAVEYIKAHDEEKYYQIRSRFYQVRLGAKVGAGIEEDQRLIWLGQKNAINLLKRQGQVWAVQAMLKE